MRRKPLDPLDLVRAHPEREFVFSFDGQPVTALPGQSVATALWRAGHLAWRRTRVGGRPRGVFCGMGSCYDCLVEIDGSPNVRACLAAAQPGAEIRTQQGDGHDAPR